MYTLLSGLYKYMFQKDEYCILILGLDNAGKTTFLEQSKTRFNKQYKGMSLSKITTTVGLNIGTVDVGKARLMFWDLGGQEELQSLWDKGNPYWAQPCCLCHAGPVVVAPSTLVSEAHPIRPLLCHRGHCFSLVQDCITTVDSQVTLFPAAALVDLTASRPLFPVPASSLLASAPGPVSMLSTGGHTSSQVTTSHTGRQLLFSSGLSLCVWLTHAWLFPFLAHSLHGQKCITSVGELTCHSRLTGHLCAIHFVPDRCLGLS
ncbi:ADP-ribosylation factor-related protein 1 isoform X2 [Sciurus carolinensis]|nr:ADP-ribosylation factor-related protein 1 isoform X2 [Sciurus carolinensis]XP_047391008.1 ADP-ribosylation factor-related protein 1 isoform X2 [Sciurus carolinensis]XP_047391014.1 ADP-ribosylation factor-related protein 1 isoform X2 [Sciurus carolinensis]XP_047391020.1 ADP-ribosylation factor-related protein 1 isoform X2 [Sciurus carolinensis]XP_047391026.1 ADP-ribosylation factor-related protein 1 isoform X2 [Sciurus carolinensis]XP_047391032.1 ADP-ribosylation factor-related protein 1 iso